MARLHLDLSRGTGAIKPLNGINNAPLRGTGEEMFPLLERARIPYSRLHDTGGDFGGTHFVDIENIFPDFSRDPEDADAYDFAFTDWLLSALVKQGVEPFYRLGATIENSCGVRAYHIFPPADPVKWARICEGIIRHYTKGWANGFHMHIRYWEIWNEPDNEPDPMQNPMWRGTMEEYFRLYEVTANHLKACFPDILVGGYASCGFYAIRGKGVERAKVSPRIEYFITFFEKFLRYLSDPAHRAPLDFFSWHTYDDVPASVEYARYARARLDEFGFVHTQSILNEWGGGPAHRGSSWESAYVAAMLCAMQREKVDLMTYYDGQVHVGYGGLFNPVGYTTFAAYDVLRAFGLLREMGESRFCESDDAAVYALAAANSESAALLIANHSDRRKYIKIPALSEAQVHRIGAGMDFDAVQPYHAAAGLFLPPHGSAYLTFPPSGVIKRSNEAEG